MQNILLPSPYKISPPTAVAADMSKGLANVPRIGKKPPFCFFLPPKCQILRLTYVLFDGLFMLWAHQPSALLCSFFTLMLSHRLLPYKDTCHLNTPKLLISFCASRHYLAQLLSLKLSCFGWFFHFTRISKTVLQYKLFSQNHRQNISIPAKVLEIQDC